MDSSVVHPKYAFHTPKELSHTKPNCNCVLLSKYFFSLHYNLNF